MLKGVPNVMAGWLTRCMIFSACAISLAFLFYSIFPLYLLFLQSDILLAVLLATLLVELPRKRDGHVSFSFGIDRTAPKNIFLAFLFVLFAQLSIFAAELCFGGSISYCGQFSLSSIMTLAALCFSVGFWEELAFRGVLLRSLSKGIGEIGASIVLSLIFAVSHSANPGADLIGFLNVFLAGLLFSLMYIKTKSLLMPILFHSLWNFSEQFLLGSPISGLTGNTALFKILLPSSGVSNLLFGGPFGIEGGLICSVTLLLLLFFTGKFATLSPFESSYQYKQDYIEAALINKKRLLECQK